VLALRQRDFDAASQRLERARDLAPPDGHLFRLLGVLESNRGRSAEAIDAFAKAVKADPRDLRARYALAQEVERQGRRDGDAEFQRAIEKILQEDPDNLAALVDLCRIAGKRGDPAALQAAVARIAGRSKAWPLEVREQVSALGDGGE
jgi:cytochrome c-type biogenesis protein CcmH/NrfG